MLILLTALSLFSGCAGRDLRPTLRVPDDGGEEPSPVSRLAFLGEATIESDLLYEGTPVGGLSAITYDAEQNLFYSVADDPSDRSPARFYGLAIDLDDGRLQSGDVTVTSVVRLSTENDQPYARYVIDGEGLALTGTGGFFLSSEGNVERGIAPRLLEITRNGSTVRSLPLPDRYLPDDAATRGVRHNMAFEALSLTPDGRWLFAGIENALVQDGSAATLESRSPARILRYDARSGAAVAEYLYWVEPVPEPPAKKGGFRVNGLVELLALDETNLLALERAFAVGTGNTIRLYHVDLSAGDDILGQNIGEEAGRITPARKKLLLDLDDLGIDLENIEGLTFGPGLAADQRSLILIADNNFSPRQRTQLLAFSWGNRPVTVSEIQGAAHLSPLEGAWLWGVEGIVTAVDKRPKKDLIWLQTGNNDNRAETSEGLAVQLSGPAEVEIGDRVVASGQVTERSRPGGLSVTRLDRATVRALSKGHALPPPVALGANLPSRIDDDGLSVFQPEQDALDLFESFEGMRVTVPESIVVGPRSRYGDFVVVPKPGPASPLRTHRGGLLLTEDDRTSPGIQIDARLLERAIQATEDDELTGGRSELRVGAHLRGPTVGVLDYSFGMFEVIATEPLPPVEPASWTAEATRLRGDSTHFTVATFNVENLDALDGQEKFEAVARTIARDLGSPDLLALQEIQDDNGPVDDGVVSADGTLAALVDAITEAGGPRYDFVQIDPENNADGGQPGANIRVAFLIATERAHLVDRPRGDAKTSTRVISFEDGTIGLSLSPGRVGADHPAFEDNETIGYQPTRKPLAIEVRFAGRQIFLINAHLKSKSGDDRPFGTEQPPQRHTERQRSEQIRVIRRFVEQILAKDPAAAVIVLADLNEHQFRSPIQILTSGSLTNLIERVRPAESYTHNFRGQSAVLDHILVSPSLAERASSEIDIVHVNADAPADERASDHDPVVVRFEMAAISSKDRP